MLWSPEWGATSLGDELSLVYWKLTRWRGKNQAAWAEKRAQEVLRGMKGWNCKEQHRAVGTSLGPLNTISLPHSPLPRLRGLPWLTWVLLLILALGCASAYAWCEPVPIPTQGPTAWALISQGCPHLAHGHLSYPSSPNSWTLQPELVPKLPTHPGRKAWSVGRWTWRKRDEAEEASRVKSERSWGPE